MKLLHFKPQHAYVGDCFPLYANNTYYIYYLQRDEVGHFTWSVAVSKDLINVDYYDSILVPGDSNSYDCELLTGCVIYHNNTFHAIYSSYGKDKKHHIMEALSNDGINFYKTNRILFERNEYYEDLDTWRDPAVYYDEESKTFHMLICAKTPFKENEIYSGCIAHATSKDLINWKLNKPFLSPVDATSIECPDLKKIDDKYVLIYYWHDSRIKIANSLFGKYKHNKIKSPCSFDFMAAKALQDDKKTILVGWIPRKSCDCSPRIWGGTLAIPKEMYFNSKGQLVCKFIDQIYNNFEKIIDANDINVINGSIINTNNSLQINDSNVNHYFAFNKKINNYLFSSKITANSKDGSIIFIVKHGYNNEQNEYEGYQIIIDFAEQRLFIREQYKWDQRPDLASMPISFKNNKAFDFEFIVNDDILEICFNKETTLSFRMSKYLQNDILSCSIQSTKAKFDDLTIKEKNI